MTEKRFECDKGSRIIIDNETKLHYIMTLDWECRLVTKLLNRFADENEQLKKEIERKEKIIQDKSELVRQQVNVSENLQARINILERALEEE